MSWIKLKELIQNMDKDNNGSKKGEAFEKLIATLFEMLLEKPFVVAKSGTQPRGDARSVDGETAIQAKNYSHKSNLRPVEVVGDLQIIINNSLDLEVYVLAVSRYINEQLLDELQKIEIKTGIDIVTLELSDDLSDLGVLCATFWKEIRHFFDLSNSDQDFLDWIDNVKNDLETQKRIEELKPRLDSGIQSQYHVKKDAEEYLIARFSQDEGYNPIDLSRAIVRQKIESELKDWWVNDDVPICYLQGEEGTGKTWLAAKWIYSIHENEKIVVLWLDSKIWNGCKSIFDLLKNCLYAIYGSDEQEKILKLQKKISKIWNKTLIVLDGANERDAIEASQTILSEYFQSKSEWRDKIRFLFTTRSLEKYPNYESYIWKKCKKLLVNSFNDSEFQKALSVIGMQNDDIPTSLKEIAIIPRYFNTCIRLRDKFGSIGNVTKELVLWIDLLEKIDGTDPQIKKKLGWHRAKDAKEILSVLAKQASWTSADSDPQISVQTIHDSIPNYRDVRNDLEEQRIVIDAGLLEVKLSKNHVVLGWALFLSSHYDSQQFTNIQGYISDLYKTLEPIPSEDLRTEAMFVALDIIETPQTQDISDNELSTKRSFFMSAWYNSNNADITESRISHCVENYTDAYAQFVEYEFAKDIMPNEEYTLIEPLAIIWKDRKGQFHHLEARLTKWLLLTYIDEYKNSSDNIDPTIRPSPNSHFTQNRLTSAALSILSQRPELNFLPTIAQCYAIHKENPQFNQNIGRLMRWGFTEDVIVDLNSLAEEVQTDETLLTGVQSLAEELKLVKTPEPLQRQLSEEDRTLRKFADQWNDTFKPFVVRIREQEELLNDDSPEVNVNGNYHGLDYLAVRTDLPDLRDEDFARIKKVLHYISKNVTLGQGVGTTLEDCCIENLLPWVAKYDPEDYSELACNLKINTLTQEWAQFKLLSIQGLIFKPEDKARIAESVIELKPSLDQDKDFYQDVTWLTHLLTETLLFCATEDELTDWFTFLASQESLRSSICYESLPYLLAILLPVSIVELAKKKLEEHRSLSSGNQNISADNTSKEMSEESYWCTLFSYGSEINEKTVNYALDDLKMREPDSTGTFPMLRLAYSDPKRLLDEASIDGNIQKHIFSQNGRKWIIQTSDENDVPSYELLSSFLPTEFIGSFLCAPDHCADLTRWGKDLMRRMNSILDGNEGDSNSIEENKFGINRSVVQTWAGQNQSDFISLSDDYLNSLSKSPRYSQVLSDFTDVIHCMLLRFQPEKAMKIYQQWIAENVRTIHYNEYGIETFIGQLWNVNQCNTAKHVQLRLTLLDECQNDEEIMFMTIAAISGGGEEELWDKVEMVYLKSHHAKERCMGVSILPWFGTSKSIEILNDLRSNDPSLWVRNYSNWAYEVAQQEQSCREVYREVLQTRDLFRTSAVFEQIKPALTPTAKYWHHKIEEEEGLCEQSQDNIPKLLALIDRFWNSWGNNSMTRLNIKIYGRKLKEYCRGEKLGFGSPPRLAPWWKPKK